MSKKIKVTVYLQPTTDEWLKKIAETLGVSWTRFFEEEQSDKE